MSDKLLVGENLVGGYTEAPVLNGCTIGVARGQTVVVVGPNGAGKSTALKALLGLVPLKEGRVRLAGEDLAGLNTQSRIAKGIGFVPQTENIFPALSVEENLEIGAYLAPDQLDDRLAQVFELFPVLRSKRHQIAGQLSGGQRQQTAIGRALMGAPQVLLLDEPTAGVAPKVMQELFIKIKDLCRAGIGVLMIEQNARQALQMADYGVVLVLGRNRFAGTGAELLGDPEVRAAFFGG